MTKQIQINEQELPYVKEIRASWIANNSHCDPNSSSKKNSSLIKA